MHLIIGFSELNMGLMGLNLYFEIFYSYNITNK